MSQEDIKKEMDSVIIALEKQGIQYTMREQDMTGLGDAVEQVLTSLGVTEERFRAWFGLRECNCTKRKKWLNNLFSWKKNA